MYTASCLINLIYKPDSNDNRIAKFSFFSFIFDVKERKMTKKESENRRNLSATVTLISAGKLIIVYKIIDSFH